MNKAYIRCMGGNRCHHQPGECTADPEYQAAIKRNREPTAMTAPFDWGRLWGEAYESWRLYGRPAAADYLRTRIEAAFVPNRTVELLGEAMEGLSARAEAAEAENARLREALVEAAIPLQAMRLAGTVESFSPEMREGVENAVQRINQALGGEHEHG